jgi:hypothetical protein
LSTSPEGNLAIGIEFDDWDGGSILGGLPLVIGREKLAWDAGLDSGNDNEDGLLSPVSRRLLEESTPVSCGRSRFRVGLTRGDGTRELARNPVCCRRPISLANMEGRSEYNCCMRSIGAKSTRVGVSMMGSAILLWL